MRKVVFYFIAVVLVGAAAVGIIVATKNSRSHDDNGSSNTQISAVKAAETEKKACGIFTLADAKQLLGDSAKGGQNGADTSSADLAVSTCTYTQDSGSNVPVSTSKSATLLVRAPKTSTGVTSNSNEFGPLKPKDVQDVAGYGDSAYWDAGLGQLNILKNNNWYILSYGPVTPAERTLDQAKQLADELIDKM